jgi:hypothetical protein
MTDGAEGATLRPRLGAAILGSFGLALEHAFPLVAVNLAWGVIVAGYLFAAVGVPVLLLALPVLALPTAAMTRLAVSAVRSGIPTLPMARDELGRLPLRKLAIAAVQLLVLGISVSNVGLAGGIGGVLGAMAAGVAVYALIVTGVFAMALWPIVCDPLRAGPLREQLRLALAVSLRRPVQLGVLALMAGLAAAASLQWPILGLFLPSVVLLAVAGYVVPSADEIAPPLR